LQLTILQTEFDKLYSPREQRIWQEHLDFIKLQKDSLTAEVAVKCSSKNQEHPFISPILN
jgi:hypothetical protein